MTSSDQSNRHDRLHATFAIGQSMSAKGHIGMAERLSVAIEYGTGRRGPLRAILDALRRIGVGERILKTTLAAFLAWELGRLIPGNPRPYLAPLTVILVLQSTIAQSVTFAFQRALGVAIGVIVALVVLETLGTHGWTIGIVILISLAVGTRLQISPLSIQQIAVSSLLVMLLGGATNEFSFAALRIVDTIIGTAVALAINALFAPPSYLPTAQGAVETLGQEVAAVLEANAAALQTGIDEQIAAGNLERARAVGRLLDETDAAVAQARTSLRYHPFAGHEREQLASIHQAGETLEHTAIQIRVISRAILDGTRDTSGDVRWFDSDRMGEPLSAVLAAAANAVTTFIEVTLNNAERDQFEAAVSAFNEKRATTIAAAQRQLGDAHSEGWVLTGEVLAVSCRLINDLADAEPNGEIW